MKTHDPTRDRNQGEGDRISANQYNEALREFVARGEVEEAARDARHFVEAEPEAAARAERKARRGPHGTRVSVEELLGKGMTMVDRARPVLNRMIERFRARFARRA